jgi:SNF2 family DNA or RNA helicase
MAELLDDDVVPVKKPELQLPDKFPLPKTFIGEPYSYQYQGAAFLYVKNRGLLGDATGSGKTIQALLAVATVHAKQLPNPKVLVVTVNSTVLQWQSEIQKFLCGFRPVVVTAEYPPVERWRICTESQPRDIVIINYSLLRNDTSYEAKTRPRKGTKTLGTKIKQRKGWLERCGFDIVIFDEAAIFKNYQTAVFQAAKTVAAKAKYAWALTAYAMSNNPMEVFGIYSVITPKLFGITRIDNYGNRKEYLGVSQFKGLFTKQRLVRTSGGGEIYVYDGGKNLNLLKERIKPHYLGRNYSDLGAQLPQLIEKRITIKLSENQRKIYEAIENDLLGTALFQEITGNLKLTTMDRPQNILTKMLQMQKAINGVRFFDPNVKDRFADNPKLDEIIRLLENEFEGEKIVIFSKFRTYIDELERALRQFNPVRITGLEDQATREQNKIKFSTDPNCRVMLMTRAGGMGLNLQAARALFLIDMPFSFGELGQVVGRIRRVGSEFQHVVVCYFIAEHTFDEHVFEILKRKKLTIEAVFGVKDLIGDVEQVDENFSVGLLELIANSKRVRQ